MANRKNYVISCSTTSRKFTLLHDGIETYLLYYDGKLIEEKVSKLQPNELYNQYWKKNWQEILKDDNPLIESIFNLIVDNLERNDKYTDAMMDNQRILTFKDLITTLNESKHSRTKTNEYLLSQNTPQSVKDKFLKLSALYDENPVDEILTLNNIEDVIQNRTNPTFNKEENEIITEILTEINYYGLLPYLNTILDNIHIGDNHKNIYRKILMLFKIMKGEASFLSETTAKAEAGKSFEDDIVFNIIAPERYIFKLNDFTSASFKRYGAISENYFDRLIVLLGDLGSKKAFKQVEGVFNIFKSLITENEFHSSKAEKNDDLKNIELHLKVDSVGAVYQTTKSSFTEDEPQLESRTIFSTPPIVENKKIMKHNHRMAFSKSSQYRESKYAEEQLKNFGLFLMYKIYDNTEIINPYEDVLIDYALNSETPIREHKQQLHLFDAYCHLTSNKCTEYKNHIWASIEQLTEYMNFVNLENALIPYENNFLQMIMAKGKRKELTYLYDNSDIYDEDGNPIEDVDLSAITTITECENTILELMNDKQKDKYIRVGTLDEQDANNVDLIQSKDDLNNQQLKEFTRRLISEYGIRSGTSEKKIFFRYSDIRNIYQNYKAYKDVDDVPQLLQTLHKKGYIGKYEDKQGKENIYYLKPKYEETTEFKAEKSFEEYAKEFIENTHCEDMLYQ